MKKKIPVVLEDENGQVDEYDMVELVKYYSYEIGIDIEDIERITPAFMDVQNYVYPESGVASQSHPAAGSWGVNILLKTGYQAQFQTVLYHDRNPRLRHNPRNPHWNQEFRIIDIYGKEIWIKGENVKIAMHALPDCKYITTNYIGKKVRVDRDDLRIRKK